MKLHRGFTLIELMIVVVIIGILTAIVMPMYNQYIIRSKIPDATSHLATMRIRMEQYYQDHLRYSSVAGGAVCGIDAPTLTPSSDYFNYTCTATSDTTYNIVATGPGTKDSSMVNFGYQIDNFNTKTTLAVDANWNHPALPAPCWITKSGGTC